MQLPPPSVLASYPTPNYVNPESKGASLLIANCVMLSVSLLVVGVRMYTRLVISRCFGADDFFILLALLWIFGVVGMAAYTYANFGGTRHVWDVVPSTIPSLLKFSFATQIVFGQAVTFVKISMLLLTRRIMGNGKKTLQYIIIFGIVFVASGNVSFTLVMIFQCRPISDIWTLSFKPQNCINEQAHLLAASIINVVSDFLVVLIPIPVVLKLKMKSRQRAVVIGLFSAGFMVCIVGIVRTVYGVILTDKSRNDFTWDAFPVYISGAVELYVGLICASIPPTRAFFSLYAPRLLSMSSSSDISEPNTANSQQRRSKFFSRSKDIEKAIPLSDLSSTASTVTAPPAAAQGRRYSSHWGNTGGKKTSLTIGVERKISVSSFEVSPTSVNEIPQTSGWRGGNGPLGQKVESQTDLIGMDGRI